MNKHILLLGGVIPVLHFLRRVQPFSPNIELIASANDVVANSKYGKKHLYTTQEQVANIIARWVCENKSRKNDWLVIPCSEFFVEYLAVFNDAGFKVFAPNQDSLEIFSDKHKLYSWLNTLGIFVGDFFELNDVLSFEDDERYIIKIAKTSPGFESDFKTAIVATRNELERVVKKVPRQFHKNYVVQRIYDNNYSVSYGGVWRNGREVASVVVRQDRQFPKGVTSAAKLYSHSSDVAVIRGVVNKISNYSGLDGFIELEFIKNEKGIIPIDLNPRLWGWSSFLFFNYPGLAENIVLERDDEVKQVAVESWSNLWRDVPAIIMHENSFARKCAMLLSLFATKRVDFICLRDIKPELLMLFRKAL